MEEQGPTPVRPWLDWANDLNASSYQPALDGIEVAGHAERKVV